DLQAMSAELLGQLEAAKAALNEKISGVDRRLADEVQRFGTSVKTLEAVAARLQSADEELGRGLDGVGRAARATEARLDEGLRALQEAQERAQSELRARQAASDEALDRTLLGLRASADSALAEAGIRSGSARRGARPRARPHPPQRRSQARPRPQPVVAAAAAAARQRQRQRRRRLRVRPQVRQATWAAGTSGRRSR
ncbi:unnamed protein product, partial [Prorocentrum cordatum]